MKDKNGFIFIETIIVLTITMVTLLALYNGYSLIIKSVENRKYYENINDVYKANVVKKMLNTDESNLVIDNNCFNYMDLNCSEILDNLNISKVLITDNVLNIINNNDYSNSLRKYVKTLNKDTKYLIIIREDNNKKYYASLKLGGYNE